MKTEEVEALAKVLFEENEAARAEHDGSPGFQRSDWNSAPPHWKAQARRVASAVARAVRAHDADWGGTLTAESIAQTRVAAESDPTEEWSSRVVLGLIDHSAAQGRTIAALEAAYAGLERTINADTDGKLALRKAHGARDDETYQEFVARLARERDDARSKFAKAQATIAALGLERDAIAAHVEDLRTRASRAESVNATLRHALHQCVSALDGLLGDSDGPDDDRPGVKAMQAAMAALNAAPAEHPDTATLRKVRAYVDRMTCKCETYADGAKMTCHRCALVTALGDSGPSGGGETRCRAGACHGGWRKPATRACGYCDDCCGHARGICAKPTTPPDAAASEASPVTPEIVAAARNAVGLPPLSASEPKPTPEEDWRTVERYMNEPTWTDDGAVKAAIACPKAEPRRAADEGARKALCSLLNRLGSDGTHAWHSGMTERQLSDALWETVRDSVRRSAEDAKDAALEEVAQDFEMLTAGGKISGLDAADAVRRRKAQPARRFVDADEVRRAAEAMRERCAAATPGLVLDWHLADGAGECGDFVAAGLRKLPL